VTLQEGPFDKSCGRRQEEAVADAEAESRRKKAPTRVLTLPDLEHAKTAVLNSLTSASGQRTYDHASREFVAWYCSEPRLAFKPHRRAAIPDSPRATGYAPATINLRLAAVRRIAYEAADAGLLSPELAAGIRRVKGVRRIGVRLGNWLTPEQGRRLLESATASTMRELRDHAMVAMLIGCGLRRAELLALRLESIQQREEHWVIADLVGKAGHVRTVPIPIWVKAAMDAWTAAAAITDGPVFRAINKAGRVWGDGMSPKVLWDVVRAAASRAGIDKLAPHDLRRTCARLCYLAGGELDQIQFLLGHVSIRTTERYLGCKQKLRVAVNDRLGIEPDAA
jgi:integrase